MPKFGAHHVTGMGSWNYGISTNPEGAAAFLEYLQQDEGVLRMSNASGAVPATKTALVKSEQLSSSTSHLYIYAKQLSTIAYHPPFHPAYPAITHAFAAAVAKIF